MWCGSPWREKETQKYHHQNNKDENDLNDDHSNEFIQCVCVCVAKQVKWLLLLKIEEQAIAPECYYYCLIILTNIMKILRLTMWALLIPMKITLPVVNLISFPRNRRPYQSTEWIISLFFGCNWIKFHSYENSYTLTFNQCAAGEKLMCGFWNRQLKTRE